MRSLKNFSLVQSQFLFIKQRYRVRIFIIKIFRLMAKFPKIKEIGRRVNKNIDILLNICIYEFKSQIRLNFNNF